MEDRSKTTSTLNVALLGYGFASKTFHAPLLTHVPGLRLTHIVSSDSAKVKKDYDVTVLAKPEEVFALPEIDLIVIATPNITHFDLASKALKAGKHVVIDKPFTNTVAEATELIILARKQRRLLSAFQSRRWDADFLTLRKVLADGALGEVAHFESHYDRYRPEPRQRWRELPGPGSGIWFDLGAHLADQALQLFGPPEAIYADLEMQRPGGQAVDYFHVILRYARNRVILHGASLVVAESPRFVVHGSLGSYTKFGMDPQEEAFKRGEIPGSPGWGQDPQPGTLLTKKGDGFETRQVPNVPGNYLTYYEGIRDAISHGAPNPVTPQQALEVINVLETGVKSSAARAESPFIPIKL
ncbi:MAG: oxidoreductase [Candidatus Acidiferrales bacterium]